MNIKEQILKNAPKPCIPQMLPFDYTSYFTDVSLIKTLTDATKKFGEYRGYLCNVVNPSLLISPLISQEAVLSSKLEGTHATLEDLLKFDANNDSNIYGDELREVSNYRQALFYALNNMSTINSSDNKLPLSGRIIREMHKILLDNVRGSTKRPGEYKRQQNYIVSANGVIFTPVSSSGVGDYISNLEQYIHYDDFNLLLQAAIIHCQFEMIHPFEDGNGRIGRLLIPLFFYYKGELPLPTFYMSSYFNQNRNLYLESLSSVSKDNDWSTWFKYFLNGIIYSSQESTQKAILINNLYNEMKDNILPQLNSVHGMKVIDFIFQHPVFKAKQLLNSDLNIPIKSVYTLLSKLEKSGILITDDNKRNRTYICGSLIKLL